MARHLSHFASSAPCCPALTFFAPVLASVPTLPDHVKFTVAVLNARAPTALSLQLRYLREPIMRNNLISAIAIGALALPLAACYSPQDTATVAQSYGPSPNLPPPQQSWIPTVDIASVVGWPADNKPKAEQGGECLRQGPRPSALALRAAERRCAGGRDQRSAKAG